ncbi:MAG: hypothetical protein WD801_16480 [Gemmatimonadaceae bacterium]
MFIAQTESSWRPDQNVYKLNAEFDARPIQHGFPKGRISRPLTITSIPRLAMLLVRELMYCKPGKVRPMVEKFVAMSALMEKAGQGKMRVMTDFVGERYWTIVSEFEVESLDAFEKMMSGQGAPMDAETQKQMDELMKGYHDLVEFGRREIYKVEN